MIAKPTDRGNWFHTYTNIAFYPCDPRPEEICIEDIARSLSMMCRFAGHLNEFYSVAQHSVLVSYEVPAKDALWGLLHDASEAYIVDIPRPLKYSPGFREVYEPLETNVQRAICDKFGLPHEQPASIKPEDNRMLLTEQRDLRNRSSRLWVEEKLVQPYDWHISPWSPFTAEQNFLMRFKQLNGNSYGTTAQCGR